VTVTETTPDNTIRLLDHGFVRLDGALADDLSVVNGARVSFARRKEEMDASDEGLIRFLMRDRHGSPFEHNAFRFHVRCPIFVAREWFRHRIGCLTGDTEVTFVNLNGEAATRKTLDQLWEMWSRGERDGHAPTDAQRQEIRRLSGEGRSARAIARQLGVGRRAVRTSLAGADGFRDARWRVRRMRVRVLDEEQGTFTVGHIGEVIDKGLQPVYRLTLADGKELTVTENHRLLTDRGWERMREAVGLVGDGDEASMTRRCALMTNGVPVYQEREWLAARRAEGLSVSEIAEHAGCSYHTVRKWLARHGLSFAREDRLGRRPWNKGRHGYSTRLRHRESHLAAIRAARSGGASNFWRGGVAGERAAIGAWTTAQAPKVHHQFAYTCQSCGTRGGRLQRRFGDRVGFVEDRAYPTRRGFRLAAHPVQVVAVTYVGLRQTFDLSIEGRWHNFLANGVVVHNSFNEFSLRYAKATDDFYVPDAEDVRTQVGKPGAYTFEPVDEALAEETREELQAVYEQAYATYSRLVERGVARELARSVLPVGAYTQFYWTVNARALMNFVSLRNSEFAQLEIRRYAEAVEAFFAGMMPVTHQAFVENGRMAP
jgi:thymidylate synthase (FAD)